MTLAELWSELRFRARAVFDRRRMERELDAELQFHLEREIAKYVGQGLSPHEAERRARLAFGGLARIKDDTREAHGTALLESFLADTRYAIRGLRARPGFSLAVIATLGLGIGVNAAIFGVLDRLLLRPPAMLQSPDRVHRVYLTWNDLTERHVDRNFAYLRYEDLTRASTSFDRSAAFAYRETAVGAGAEVREAVIGAVSASYFDFFNAPPLVGRYFTADEDRPDNPAAVAVLSYAYWQSQHGARRDIIGSTINIGPATYTVIGVAPKGFVGVSDLRTPAAFVPITQFASTRAKDFNQNYGWSWLEILVRRKPDANIERATADMVQAHRRSWQAELARSPQIGSVAKARPDAVLGPLQLGRGPLAGPEARVVKWIAGVATIVLLIACANVANLLLLRSLRRRREIAVRYALGGSRGRIVRQLLTETLLLSCFGGIAGLIGAQWGAGVLRRVFLDEVTSLDVIADPRTIWFALVATVGAALVAGLAPALRGAHVGLSDSLKAGGRGVAGAQSRTRSALLVFQGSLSVLLLIGAGLFLRSLHQVQAIRMGYDASRLLIVQANSRGVRLGPAETRALTARLIDQARALSIVENATEAITVPFYSSEGRSMYVDGRDSLRKLGRFVLQIGSPTYFATTGTRIVRGRGISEEDREGSPWVAVVSEAMAKALWPTEDAIGRCFRIISKNAPCRTVVGVAENIKARSLTESAGEFHYYLPATQYELVRPMLFVRTRDAAAGQTESVRQRLQAVMPGDSYVNVISLEDVLAPTMRPWDFGTTMFTAFAGLALVLAAVGLYAIIAFTVAQRTQEIGIRLALGARSGDVVRMVIRNGLVLATLGVVIGSGTAYALSTKLGTMLYRVSPHDPVVYAGVGAILWVVAIAASALPAIRASRVDPNIALRIEG